MALIDRIRKQKAVWWREIGKDDHGRPRYAAPVVIECRWEDCVEEFIDDKGTRTVSKAKVYVDRATPSGVLWNSGQKKTVSDAAVLALLTSKNDPFKNPGAALIRAYGNLPNLRASKFLKWVML